MNVEFVENLEKYGFLTYLIIYIADSLPIKTEKNGSAECWSGSVVTKTFGKQEIRDPANNPPNYNKFKKKKTIRQKSYRIQLKKF